MKRFSACWSLPVLDNACEVGNSETRLWLRGCECTMKIIPAPIPSPSIFFSRNIEQLKSVVCEILQEGSIRFGWISYDIGAEAILTCWNEWHQQVNNFSFSVKFFYLYLFAQEGTYTDIRLDSTLYQRSKTVYVWARLENICRKRLLVRSNKYSHSTAPTLIEYETNFNLHLNLQIPSKDSWRSPELF
jgi:hypothetical protein